MADWDAIRRIARERREGCAASSAGARALIPAEELLAACMEKAGLSSFPVPPDDPLLAGAHAVLDRDAFCIWHNGDLSPETTRFNLAHELAHWWLHDESAPCHAEDLLPDPVADPLPYGQDYVAGYSPAQRREVEANVFAAEFLLPAPALREAYLAGESAADMARRVGVSETAVLGQMAEAILGSWGEGEPAAPQPAGSPSAGLDASQKAAAEVERGPVLISAGPGTGKTRTLVARVLFLLERGVAPEQILALTFSNKAAAEMRERLEAVTPDAARRIWIGTFHAFGLELLRRYGTRLGLPPAPALLDPVDAVALLDRHLDRLELSEYEYLHNPSFPFRDILSAISRAKDELVSPEHYAELAGRMAAGATDDKSAREAARAREVAGVYAAWRDILQEEGKLDFGDLLSRAVELLRDCPDVLAQVREQFRHVLVDEYQDINRASAVLVKMVAGEGEGLWAVGDLRQAIYRFRGASPANLTCFEQDYPGGRRLTLDVNYRSRPDLVALFARTARRMSEGDEAAWEASRCEGGDAVVLAEAENEAAQVDGVAAAIRRFEAAGVPLREQAVLCRTNAQAEALSEALGTLGVPALYLGDLLARPEVRDMLSLLALAAEPGGVGLVRVATFPEYEMPQSEVLEVLREAEQEGAHVLSLLGHRPGAGAKIAAHVSPLAYRGDAFFFLSRYLFGPADYLRRLLREDTIASRQKLLALHQLLLLARAHTARLGAQETNPQRAFLAHVRYLLATGEDTRARIPAGAAGIDAVQLMTVHASKGLEFPVVFVPNLAKDLFPTRKQGSMVKPPHGLTGDNGDEQSEEERLFFVALSRARDHLVLSRPAKIKGRPREASALLGLLTGDVSREAWHGSTPDAADEEPSPNANREQTAPEPETLPDITVAEAEMYQRCPLQYYYTHVLKLPSAREQSAYVAFQDCLWDTIYWMRERESSGEPTSADEARERLAARWEEKEVPEHAHTPVLRARAEEIITRLCRAASVSPTLPTGEVSELVAELPEGRIRLRVDQVAEGEDGGLMVERYTTARPADDDHTAPRLALLRLAAKQARAGKEPQVRLRYLNTGEEKAIPEQKRYEPARVAKYSKALLGIARGEFPPGPSQECARCPFFFICPANAANPGKKSV